jgi:hypothetical protein
MKLLNKKILIPLIAVAIVIIGVLIAVVLWPDHNKDTISIKDDVFVISDEGANESTVTDDEIILRNLSKQVVEHIKEDGTIVFPISEQTPNGGLYKMHDIEKNNGEVSFSTSPATLGDVFNTATFSQEFELTADGEFVPDDGDTGNTGLLSNLLIEANAADSMPSDLSDDYKFLFNIGDKLKIPDKLATIQAGIDFKINVEFEVSDMGQHVYSGVTASADTGVLARLNNLDIEEEFDIAELDLPPVQFFVGIVPIVITNSLTIDGTLTANAEYQPDIGLYYHAGKIFGYSYDNTRSEKLQKINEDKTDFEKSFDPSISNVDASCDVDIAFTVGSLLYGSAGLNGNADIKTYLKGSYKDDTIQAGVKIDAGLSASLLVKVPVIDYELINTTLWESERFKIFPTGSEWYNLLDPNDKTLDFTDTAPADELNHMTVSYFTFDYPSNWTISSQDISENHTPQDEREFLYLTNERGVTISYFYWWADTSIIGSGHMMWKAEIEKVADSQFIPGSVQGTNHADLGSFMVAKVYNVGELFLQTDIEYSVVDDDPGTFAVLPESWIGEQEGMPGLATEASLAFEYSNLLSFTCTIPEGGLTDAEEREVIQILSSFRTKDADSR